MIPPFVLHLNKLSEFIEEVEKSSKRDALFFLFMAHKARSINETIHLKMNDINWKESSIIGIPWDFYFGEKLTAYLKERDTYPGKDSPYLFITKRGKPVYRTHISKVLNRTSKKLNFGFNVVGRMIQWSYVRYWMKHNLLSKKEIKEKINLKSLPRLIEFTQY